MWALGSNFLTGTIGTRLELMRHNTDFMLRLWMIALLKLVCAVAPFQLIKVNNKSRNQSYLITLAIGIVINLYSGYCVLYTALIKLQFITLPSRLTMRALQWHFWFWNPVWVIGGFLFVATALSYKKVMKSNRAIS